MKRSGTAVCRVGAECHHRWHSMSGSVTGAGSSHLLLYCMLSAAIAEHSDFGSPWSKHLPWQSNHRNLLQLHEPVWRKRCHYKMFMSIYPSIKKINLRFLSCLKYECLTLGFLQGLPTQPSCPGFFQVKFINTTYCATYVVKLLFLDGRLLKLEVWSQNKPLMFG